MARYGGGDPEGLADGAPRSVFVSAARSVLSLRGRGIQGVMVVWASMMLLASINGP